jgi:hypothetical protein
MRCLLCLALVLGMPVVVQADPVLSCEEIDEVGEALTGLGIAMDDEDAEIGQGSPEDAALRDVVLGLATIADAEDDADLRIASGNMSSAWEAMDRESYIDALANAVAKLAVISVTECEE